MREASPPEAQVRRLSAPPAATLLPMFTDTAELRRPTHPAASNVVYL